MLKMYFIFIFDRVAYEAVFSLYRNIDLNNYYIYVQQCLTCFRPNMDNSIHKSMSEIITYRYE